MKFRFEKKYLYWGLTAFFVIAASILFYYVVFHRANLFSGFAKIMKISMPIIDGFVLAYLFTPIMNRIEKRIIKPLYVWAKKSTDDAKNKKRIRGFSIIITLMFVLIVLYEFLNLVIPELVRSVQSIIFQFPVYINNLSNWALGLLKNNPDLEDMVDSLIDQYSEKVIEYFNTNLLPQVNALIKTLSISVLGFFKSFWNFIIGFIISIYLLGSKEKFAGQAKKIAYALFERKNANEIIQNFRFVHNTFIGFLSGKIIDSIIIGIICFVCTSIIGTPYAILVSVIIGVTNMIPFFGPWIGGIPSALLVLMVDPRQALYFIILILIIQQFDGNILGPKILGDSTGLSGFWVIFAITVFGGLFGVFGMIVGIPIFAVIYAGIRALVHRSLAGKQLPTETEKYITVGKINSNNEFEEFVVPEKKTKTKTNKKLKFGNKDNSDGSDE